jgi:subtilisin family serine protease
MNRYFIILALLLFTCFTAQAQSNYHNMHYLDPYNPEFVKGEVLLKFVDEVVVTTSVKNDVAQTGVASVDDILVPYQILKVSKVFKETREQHSKKPKRTMRDFKGKEMEVPALYNIYKLKFDTAWDVKQIVEALQADKQIAFAEPNYLVYTAEVLESGLVPDQAPERPSLPENKGTQNTSPNDPLYQNGSQWYLDAINAPAAWDIVTGDTSQIIAIIDTGVDWDHPDLDDNIWTNWDEIPNNDIDDDNNGYVDDTRGWDYINNDNDPNDDNSHGTHVAGIAAAEGNNEIGICGVAWNSKIMPVKMLQSSGTGNSSDLASAIEYASDNGATVINMSLGSYGESLTVKNALENAYAGTGDGEGSILVAAAGNNALKVSVADPCKTYGINPAPMFPAAYSWVLGVMAEDAGPCKGFSNWDFDGPVAFEGFNYEIQAKGVGIMSTKPNGSYWIKSGTSMASPEVAGAVAIMRKFNADDSGEQIFAKLIQGSNAGLMDIYSSLTTSLVPDLYYIDYTIVDTLPGCDGDGRADAGETIQLYLTIKNAGGQADSVWAKLRFGQFEDTTTANILDSTSFIGSMSAYSTMTGEMDPFIIEIDSDVANNRDIVFEAEVWHRNDLSVNSSLALKTEKGIEIGGVITSDITLSPNNLYLLTSNLRISEGASLTILPGTIIKFYPEKAIDVRGRIIAIGKPDSLIKFESNDLNWYGDGIVIDISDTSIIQYSVFSNLFRPITTRFLYVAENFSFIDNTIKNCHFNKPNYFNYGMSIDIYNNIIFNKNVISNNIIDQFNLGYFFQNDDYFYGSEFFDNVIVNNLINSNVSPASVIVMTQDYSDHTLNSGNSLFNNFLYNIYDNTKLDLEKNMSLMGSTSYGEVVNNYWGMNDSIRINETIYDFDFDFNLPSCIFTPVLSKPSIESHGVTWKININNTLINKYDNPSNTSTGLGVIGAESLKFDVYFNRPMDTSYTPLLTFGVREPYTQHIVADSASWSADSTIWTAYKTITATTGDGIQRVRVANARDDERFEIPIEDSRFEFVIQAAAAASIEFYANAGIGKVDLEWPPTPSEDALGYNLYRFYNLTDSTYSDTLMINTELVLDTLFTDYNVIPETTYHYLYKTLGTDMVETDYSKKATATPFSAANGDANGDLTVNVLDITTIVSYILNQNPQPFLSDAADVNYDGQINLLDIIGVVNLIMNNKAVSDRPYPMISQQKAYYEWRGNQLWLHSQGNVAGLQFDLALPENMELDQLRIKSRLPGFEMASQIQAANIQGLLYSLDGKTIPSGENCLLELIGAELPGELQFNTILGGELEGDLVEVLPYGIDDLPEQGTEQQVLRVQPNPFSHQLLISWDVPEANKVVLNLYDQQGRLIKSLYEGNDVSGNTYWEGKDQHNKSVSKGVYILRMELQQKEGLQSVERKIIFN